jgi:hypothetical protein
MSVVTYCACLCAVYFLSSQAICGKMKELNIFPREELQLSVIYHCLCHVS